VKWCSDDYKGQNLINQDKSILHIGQERRIETELAFTIIKNATKPNPFEIISLQTTGKENNWKTGETLARTVVTLETERIERSNP
jgi:hypothetical protein